MKSETKLYEIAYLVQDPEAEKEVVQAITQQGGVVKTQQPARAIRLAYPIRKHTSAYFGVIHAECAPQTMAALERVLQLSKSVIRFLVIVPPRVKAVPERKMEARKPAQKAATSKSILTNDALEAKLAALENESQ